MVLLFWWFACHSNNHNFTTNIMVKLRIIFIKDSLGFETNLVSSLCFLFLVPISYLFSSSLMLSVCLACETYSSYLTFSLSLLSFSLSEDWSLNPRRTGSGLTEYDKAQQIKNACFSQVWIYTQLNRNIQLHRENKVTSADVLLTVLEDWVFCCCLHLKKQKRQKNDLNTKVVLQVPVTGVPRAVGVFH